MIEYINWTLALRTQELLLVCWIFMNLFNHLSEGCSFWYADSARMRVTGIYVQFLKSWIADRTVELGLCVSNSKKGYTFLL